jgi:hypothetical protein
MRNGHFACIFCRQPGADTMRVELIRSALFVDSVIPATDRYQQIQSSAMRVSKGRKQIAFILAVSYLSK